VRVTKSRLCGYVEVVAAESVGTIGIEEQALTVPRQRRGRIVRGGIENGIPATVSVVIVHHHPGQLCHIGALGCDQRHMFHCCHAGARTQARSALL
jgi:hypothetical protein